MKTWVLPCNTEHKYDVFGAFDKFPRIDWHQTRQTKNIEVGDIAYIYANKRGICFKCRVTKTDIHDLEIHDKEFCIDDSYENGHKEYFEVECIKKYPANEVIDFATLKERGLTTTLQGPLQVKGDLLRFLQKYDGVIDADIDDINIPLKPKAVKIDEQGSVIITCGNCGKDFKKAPRCPECGQLIDYE